ncbi:hypothetical protein [Kocuria sp.]|uniref:STAS domain-containing protein n=1 Tax=Kocuria sp. TaxID=1871328 RepID=UPI00281177D2|nr:hypothetical protein [Kocuria sp.]
MELQLSVRFEVTPDGHQVRLVAMGELTETNQQVLYPLLHRAWALTSATEVVIDLTAVEHLDTAALDLLCWEVEHHQPDHLTQPVCFTLPQTPPANGPPPAPGNSA